MYPSAYLQSPLSHMHNFYILTNILLNISVLDAIGCGKDGMKVESSPFFPEGSPLQPIAQLFNEQYGTMLMSSKFTVGCMDCFACMSGSHCISE